MRYSNLTSHKRNGVVYTPPELAQFVAEQMLKYQEQANWVSDSSHNLETCTGTEDACTVIKVLDPAVGGGELLIAMAQQLLARGVTNIHLVGYDTDTSVAQETQQLLEELFPQLQVEIRAKDFLADVEAGLVEQFNYVIANPPYVRTQILGQQRAQEMLTKLHLSGRVDIYYAFLLYTKSVLLPHGIAGYITSNKFMTIKAGQAVRKYMLEHYQLHHIFDLGDTKLFNAAVLPCVLIFSLGSTQSTAQVNFTSVYETVNCKSCESKSTQSTKINSKVIYNSESEVVDLVLDSHKQKADFYSEVNYTPNEIVISEIHSTSFEYNHNAHVGVKHPNNTREISSIENVGSFESKNLNLFAVLNSTGVFSLSNGKSYQIQQGKLGSLDPQLPWCIATDADAEFIVSVESNTVQTFATLGKIRVGIKSTADNVFIGDDWEQRGKDLELLRPLITHRSAGQLITNHEENSWQVLYPHSSSDGKAYVVNIEEYPNSHAYLLQHFKQLDGRNYVKKAKRQWYELWVPQNPASWNNGKIVFRDIAEEPQFWWDDTGAVVNGDCYWIEIRPEVSRELVYLALAVANSKFIEKYYDIKFNNKIYGNKRRYQSQYVEQFPLPSLESVYAQEAVQLVQKIIATQTLLSSDKQRLDDLVMQMFSC